MTDDAGIDDEPEHEHPEASLPGATTPATGVLGEVEHFLAAQRVLVLATSLKDVPMAHAMHYVPRGLTVYVSSLPGTQKLANIASNPTVGYAVWRLPSYERRDTMRSLQVRGNARLVEDKSEVADVRAGLDQRYPWAPELALDFNATVAIEPQEILWLDGSKGLEGRTVLRLDASGPTGTVDPNAPR